MGIVEFEEIKENFGIGVNDEGATFELKLEYSEINGIELRLVRDSNINTMFLLIIQPNGNNFIYQSDNLNELKDVANKIVLNLECLAIKQKETNIEYQSDFVKAPLTLLNKTVNDDKIIKDCMEGFLIRSTNDLRINGQKLKNIDEIIPFLLSKITTQDDSIDFNLMEYSMITKNELFKSLLDITSEYTTDEIILINQYKRGEGPAFAISKFLRTSNLYYLKIPDIELIKRWETLFTKAPKLKKDVILYRGGSGSNRNNAVGVTNLYDGLISFSLERSIGEHFATTYRGNALYRMKLKKGTNCLGLFCLDGLEGRFIGETEILMPSFLYQVIRKNHVTNKDITEFKLSYLGNISMMELMYEKLKQALKFPKLKYISSNKELICDSNENQSQYISNGYNPSVENEYKQIEIKEATKFLYDRDMLNEIIEGLYEILMSELNYISDLHGFMHIQRVYFMAMLLAELDGLNDEDKRLLTATVKYHDIGRENDYEDIEHGKKSVEKLLSNEEILKDFSKEEQEIILFAIENHSKNKFQNEESLKKIPNELRDRCRKILNYLKDADKLDRVRLGVYETTDINRLSLETSKRLILLSYELEKYYADIFEYLRELTVYKGKISEIGDTIKLIEKEGYEKTNPEFRKKLLEIIEGGINFEPNEEINVDSIYKVTKSVNINRAKEYFDTLLNKLKTIRGGRRGKR